jgi:hypothetical protein
MFSGQRVRRLRRRETSITSPHPGPIHRAEPRRLALRRKSFGPDVKLLREASTK